MIVKETQEIKPEKNGRVKLIGPLLKNVQTFRNLQNDLPDTVRQWLAGALGLKGVPFHYLVPDARMLPVESVRFFQVDPAWMRALLDGACSVGHGTQPDVTHDRALADDLYTQACTAAKLTPSSIISGLLIRSALISGWPDTECRAYATEDTSQSPLPVFRRDRLAKDILLVLFHGVANTIVISEPAFLVHAEYKDGQTQTIPGPNKTEDRLVNLAYYNEKKYTASQWATDLLASLHTRQFTLTMEEPQ